MARSLTMLNESGDTTISWTEDLDDQIEAIIRKKMDEGCAFFIVERDNNGVRAPLVDAADAKKHRALAIPDDDLRKFVSGGATATVTPDAPIRSSRKSTDAKEIAKSDSVGVRQRRGG